MLADLHELAERPRELCDLGDAPVLVHQVRWEWQQLQRLYHQHRPRRVLEIGTYHGGTLWGWLHATWAPRIVCVDTFTAHDGRAIFTTWAQAAGIELHLVAGDSRHTATVAQVRELGPFDWILIDGDHSAEAVQLDWRHYAPMCAPGGVVLLHDINPRPEYGVSDLWRELQHAGEVTQEINAGAPNLCGIGVVYR